MVATAMAGGTDNNQLKLAAKTRWQWRQQWKQQPRAQQRLPRRANDCPGHWRRWNRLCHHLGGLWVLDVTVVCGVVRASCVCAARPCCFVRGSRAKVHQKFGKPWHIGDLWQLDPFYGRMGSSCHVKLNFCRSNFTNIESVEN